MKTHRLDRIPIATAVSAVLVLGMCGCRSQRPPQVYQSDALGVRVVAPAGWSERSKHEDAPTPAAREQLLVQYKRLTAGRPAWLRVTVASMPASATPAACLSGRSPGKDWRAEGSAETLEINGQPAARVAYAGRWQKNDYVCEMVAVRQGERVYFFTASFPADDVTAREEVRKAVTTSTWKPA